MLNHLIGEQHVFYFLLCVCVCVKVGDGSLYRENVLVEFIAPRVRVTGRLMLAGRCQTQSNCFANRDK